MTSSLFLKKSTVSGTVPVASELTSSELAINIGDGTLYYRNVTSSLVEPINAGSASFAETASFALNAGAGGDGGDGGDTFNYFDADKIPDGVSTSSLNDEFTESGSLGVKWTFQNVGSVSASQDGDSLLTLTNNLTGGGIHLITQPIPSGSWVIRAKIAFESFPDTARQSLGLVLQNAVNENLEVFSLVAGVGGIGPGHHLQLYDTPTVFSSTVESVAHTKLEMIEWYYLEIDYNGVDIGYRISRNGLGFDEAFAATRTTGSHLAGSPTHFGFTMGMSEADFTGSIDWFRIASISADINGGLRTVGSVGGGGGGGGFGGDFSGSFSGSVTGTFVGDSDATGSLTGTLTGSASFAENASTAVLAVSAVTAITASNANTASFADDSLFTAFRPIKTVEGTNPYDVVFQDYVLLIDATSGTLPIDVQMPNTADFMKGPASKKITIIKSSGSNNVQIMASGTQDIIGFATATLTDRYQGLTLQPSGNVWWVI